MTHCSVNPRKDAVDDIISALRLDPGTVVPEIRSLRPEARVPLTQGLHSRCRALLSQTLDTGVSLGDEDTQGLLAVGEALTKIDATQPSWHLLLTDILMALGRYEEAATHLQEGPHPTPPSDAAHARQGLLLLKKGAVPTAARALQGLAETDAQDLRFLLQLLGASERQNLSQVAAQEASILLDTGHPRRALGYCSLAVLAGGTRTCHLRLRAACLAELQEFDRALQDMDRVIQDRAGDGDLPRQAEDFSFRGHLLLSLGDEERATGAFAQALELSPALAQSRLWEQPGQAPTASMFLRLGQCCLEEQRCGEAWTVAQSGLLVNPNHSGLKRLKAQTQKEASSGCRLL